MKGGTGKKEREAFLFLHPDQSKPAKVDTSKRFPLKIA